MSCYSNGCVLLEDGTPLLLEDGSGCLLLEFALRSHYSITLDQLKEMIAASETFQNAVGGTEADVKNHIHFGRQVGSPPRPFALIELEDGAGNAISFGAGNQIIAEGGVMVRFETDACTEHPESYIEAVDWIGRVVDEVNALAAHGDDDTVYNRTHLPLLTVSLRRLGANDRSTWHSLGRFYAAETLWTWGDA